MKDKKQKLGFGEVINSLNKQLEASQSEIYNFSKEEPITLHIIGAPRSGTTLLTQLILSNFDIGYINNLIAAFWKSPVYGIHLSKKLLGENFHSNYTSKYGATDSIKEPHEFSYFWKYFLNYNDFLQQTYNEKHQISWNLLKTILSQMYYAFEKPIVFKSFQYGFHAANAVKQMPKSLFILIKRDVFQNAYSIYKMRKNFHNDLESWASIKPVQYHFLKKENLYRQIMGQVLFLNYEYEKQLCEIPEINKLIIQYSELCLEPSKYLQLMSKKLGGFSTNVIYKKCELEVFKIAQDVIPEEIHKEFKKAYHWLLKNYPELNTKNV